MNLLGKIPKKWVKARIRDFCDVQLGKMLQNDPSSEHDELKPYLRAINITNNGVNINHEFSMWIRPQEIGRFRLRKWDILVSEGGDVGRVAIFDMEGEYYFQNAINRVRPDHRGRIEFRFIYYWFMFLKISGYVEMVSNVATIPHFTAEKVKTAPLALPPLATQRRIARFLDEKTARIDGLIRKMAGDNFDVGALRNLKKSKAESLLGLLMEYRAALITMAVTGQMGELNGD